MGLFGVSKKAREKWPHLSEADAELAWKYVKADSWKRDTFVKIAIEGQRYDALAAMLQGARLWYSSSIRSHQAAFAQRDLRAVEMIANASRDCLDRDDQGALLRKVTEEDANWGEGLAIVIPLLDDIDVARIVNAIGRIDTAADRRLPMQALLKARQKDAVKVVTLSLKKSTDMFDLAMAALPDDSRTPTILAQIAHAWLQETNKNKVPHAFDALLASGANVNHDKGVLLTEALRSGQMICAQAVLDKGFNLQLLGRSVLEDLYSQGASAAATAYLEERLGVSAPAPSAAVADDGYRLVASDTLARTIALPDGGSLTMLFNFALAQQIVVQQPANANQPVAPAVVPFDTISNGETLRTAAEVFCKLGGDAQLAERAQSTPRSLITRKPGVGDV